MSSTAAFMVVLILALCVLGAWMSMRSYRRGYSRGWRDANDATRRASRGTGASPREPWVPPGHIDLSKPPPEGMPTVVHILDDHEESADT